MPGRKAPEEMRREDILRAAYDVAMRHGVEGLTVRAVAERADVSHGTVLFHFKRRDELVNVLLDRVLAVTTIVRIPESVERLTRPAEKLLAVLRAEMDRLSADPRHFRLFLEYWTLGLRNAPVRKKIGGALEAYRASLRALAESVVEVDGGADGLSTAERATGSSERQRPTVEGVTAVAVSLVHGCALQAVIDPKGFDVEQHFRAAGKMLDEFAREREPAGRLRSRRAARRALN